MNKNYEKLFNDFKKENPNFEKYLTDSVYYDLVIFYDDKMGLTNDDNYSDESLDFANYVWYTYIFPPKFKIGDDVIEKKNHESSFIITKIKNGYYYSEDLVICPIGEQDRWELEVKNKEEFVKKYKHIVESDWFKESYIDNK